MQSIHFHHNNTKLVCPHWLLPFQISFMWTIIMWPGGVSPAVEWVWSSLTRRHIQKLKMLLNNHIYVAILCWLRSWPAMHHGIRQIEVFCLKSQDIITMSRHTIVRPTAALSASCCPGQNCHKQLIDRRMAIYPYPDVVQPYTRFSPSLVTKEKSLPQSGSVKGRLLREIHIHPSSLNILVKMPERFCCWELQPSHWQRFLSEDFPLSW